MPGGSRAQRAAFARITTGAGWLTECQSSSNDPFVVVERQAKAVEQKVGKRYSQASILLIDLHHFETPRFEDWSLGAEIAKLAAGRFLEVWAAKRIGGRGESHEKNVTPGPASTVGVGSPGGVTDLLIAPGFSPQQTSNWNGRELVLRSMLS
jgi:hypothetical protein